MILHIPAGAPRQLYVGDCPRQYTYKHCWAMGFGGDKAGILQRVDEWIQRNRVKLMREGKIPQRTVPIDPKALLNGTVTLTP